MTAPTQTHATTFTGVNIPIAPVSNRIVSREFEDALRNMMPTPNDEEYYVAPINLMALFNAEDENQ
jgi:hypothetical protein